MRQWYELHKEYEEDGTVHEDVECFWYADDGSMRDAKARLIARVAVLHTVAPNTVVKAYACHSDRFLLEWIE